MNNPDDAIGKAAALAQFVAKAEEVCRVALGVAPSSREVIDGRPIVRARVGTDSVIVHYRRDPARVTREWAVMTALHEQGAPIPRPIFARGQWFIQEDVGTVPLSRAIADGSGPGLFSLLGDAIDALAATHRAGAAAGLASRVPALGSDPRWTAALLQRIAAVSTRAGVALLPAWPAPFQALLRPREQAFIKWDARPDNAMVASAGGIIWFDWEHACARHRTDDLIWLLCDETVADDAETEGALLASRLGQFQSKPRRAEADPALIAFAIAHSLVRIDVRTRLAERDVPASVPLTLGEIRRRQIGRAVRWSRRNKRFREATDWLRRLRDRWVDADG
ncbi:MAG: phosphotransferase [Hyphomicrobiales bacterium]|nr:phosphotransferase [Hyphomicrobiales bacterium]